MGTLGGIAYACSEDDRAREKIKKLKAENEQLNSASNYISGIKTKLSTAKEYLIEAKSNFKDGGHVKTEFHLQMRNSHLV